MTIYITERCRFLTTTNPTWPKSLHAVRATVSDKPHDPFAKEKDYTPKEWQALMAQDGVLYRYNNTPYKPIN